MRLRHIKGAEETTQNHPLIIQQPQQLKGRWQEVFAAVRPLEIEIGMGKGRFITLMAESRPFINFIGIERCPSVLVRALNKLTDSQTANLRFLCLDAQGLSDVFAPGEVSRIYLNFPDPWPKKRHAHRRLTDPSFLEIYRTILSEGGTIEFKTDNRPLFDVSVDSFKACGWSLLSMTTDLHANPMAADNIMTEYEIKFSKKGNPICKLIARC